MRLAYKLMTDHGMRAHDIDRTIKRVAIAVFFITEDEKDIAEETAILKQSNRLRMEQA